MLSFYAHHVHGDKKMLLKRQQFSENKVGLYSCCSLTLSILTVCVSQIAHSQGGEQLTLCWWHFFSRQVIMLFVSCVILCNLLLTLSYCRVLRMSRHAYMHIQTLRVKCDVKCFIYLCRQLLRLYSGSDRWMNDCGELFE